LKAGQEHDAYRGGEASEASDVVRVHSGVPIGTSTMPVATAWPSGTAGSLRRALDGDLMEQLLRLPSELQQVRQRRGQTDRLTDGQAGGCIRIAAAIVSAWQHVG
jgi:hypothetical protein